MTDIEEKVKKIRQAQYGKDVRETIASGIEGINQKAEDVTSYIQDFQEKVESGYFQGEQGEKGDSGSIENATAQDIVTSEGSNVQAELNVIKSNGWVTATRLASSSVTTVKLADRTITLPKLANKLQENFQDTGWINITLASGVTADAQTPQCRRVGNRVFLRGAIAGGATGPDRMLYTLPVGFRPTIPHGYVAPSNNIAVCRFDISHTGVCTLMRRWWGASENYGGNWHNISTSFLID